MKSILAICVLVLGSGVWGLGQTPPLPDGAARGDARPTMQAAVSIPAVPTGIFRLEVDRTIPGVEIVSCYVTTNCPARWRIEGSEDLQSWRTWTSWPSTNDRRRYTVPRLRDDARLVDWYVLRPNTRRFFRLTILP